METRLKSRMIVHLMAVLVLASVLAGCLDLDSFAPQNQEQEQASGSGAADPTPQEDRSTAPADPPEPAPEQEDSDESEQEPEVDDQEPEEPEPVDPPVARLLIDNEAVSELTGDAPLKASFVLDAEYGEPTELEWSFSPGDGSEQITGSGDELPFTLNHTYGEPGEFTANFSVSAQGDHNMTLVSVKVEKAVPEVVPPVRIEGEALVGNPAHSVYCVRSVQNTPAEIDEEIDGEIHALDPAGPGWRFLLEPAGNFTIYWYDDAGPLWIVDALHPEEESPRATEAESVGVVPDGATHVEVCMDDPTDTTPEGFRYVLTLWAPGHPGAPAV